MTEKDSADKIEGIVGHRRHLVDHYARAVSDEQRVYIMHSHECLFTTPDLRDCPYSLALDRGIDLDYWVEDVPLRVNVSGGHLLPSPTQVEWFQRRERGKHD